MNKGLIIKLIGGQYTVLDTKTKETLTCVARGKFRHMRLDKDSSFLRSTTKRTKIEAQTVKLSPKVGDLCTYDSDEDINQILTIEPRKNDLFRPDIANVDQVLLIFAAKEPAFSFILLDRFIVILEKEHVKPVIIITKIDLMKSEDLLDLKEKMLYYEAIGYPVYYVNSKTGEGFNQVKEVFRDKISVLSGQTGAGKSTFLNQLIPGFTLKTQEISKALGRGKHTTRHTELYPYNNGMIADTPGFSKLDYGQMEVDELPYLFTDFSDLASSCKFKNKCMHISEPGCAVKAALSESKILPSRYDNYVYFVDEIKNIKPKY